MNYRAFLIVAGFMTASAMAIAQGNSPRITILSSPTLNPIMKRLETNPVLRLTVTLPENDQPKAFRRIEVSVSNADVLSKLEVFATDTIPVFSVKNRVGSLVNPSSKKSSIPVDLLLHAGLNYIWLSVAIKDESDIKTAIDIQATALVDEKNQKTPVAQPAQKTAKRIGVAVRKGGDDQVNTYRIPGLATTDKGTLLAVYDVRYNGYKDLPENIDVGLSRSTDGGRSWQPMKVIIDMGEPQANNGVGDPSILFDPKTNTIWVAALWSKGNRSIAGSEPGLSPDSTGQLVLVNSNDDGLTWSSPYNITSQVKNPAWHLYFQGPGNGIAMQNGTLVFPSQYWDESKKPGLPHSAIIYSEDHGKTWKSGTGAKPNTTESSVVETTPGRVMLNMRDNRGAFRSIATSADMGATWTEHASSRKALPDPVCMGSLLKAKVNVKGVQKEVLFFSNPNSSIRRDSITIKASLDFGETWLPANQLLIDDRRCDGYSSLTKIDENTLGILYEGVRDLYFVRVKVNEIIK